VNLRRPGGVRPGVSRHPVRKGRAVEKTEVRIVAGSLRGRKIQVGVHPGLRPTPQMVREALFSILGNAVPGRPFYDVFAGTGVVGLEAVSRGASEARLIESDARQAADIRKYAERFGVADKAQVLRADAYRWAERWVPPAAGGPVNLFLSPPFPDLAAGRLDAFLGLVRQLLDKAPDESVLVIQAEEGFPLDSVPDPTAWDVRTYGRNLLMFYVVSRSPVPPAGANPG
jgi:16S rRNA (guanine966-N2)-methyltransferase